VLVNTQFTMDGSNPPPDEEDFFTKLLPNNEARSRLRRGRTGSLLIDEMMKNTDLSDLAEDAPPTELLEKAVLDTVNNKVDAAMKDMTEKHKKRSKC